MRELRAISYLVGSGYRRTRDAANADTLSVDGQSRIGHEYILIRAYK